MPAVFTIDRGYAGQPQKRGTLTLNRATGEVVRWETFDSLSRGRQLRSWLRFSHTGEYYGLAGQTIAGLVSAGGAVVAAVGASSCAGTGVKVGSTGGGGVAADGYAQAAAAFRLKHRDRNGRRRAASLSGG